MAITLPNLDDRRFADLVEEARDLLVANAPALTNHNPSDPVITLVELFAYFTEALSYRANLITDAHRATFLRLLNGPDWPTPATRAGLDAEVRRTILALRQTDRAVTAADFEFLARAADPAGRVARAQCIPERNLEATDPTQFQQRQPAHVSVVIVPFQSADLPALKTIVADYLEPRRLLTARVHVVGPRTRAGARAGDGAPDAGRFGKSGAPARGRGASNLSRSRRRSRRHRVAAGAQRVRLGDLSAARYAARCRFRSPNH